MEFQKLIEARRSIRSYDDTKKVTEEQIRQLVEAAIQAPSWKNSQTARYYAVLSDEMRQKLAEECLPAFNIKNTHGAALVVTTFVENRSGYNKATGEPENEAGNGWGYYDMGLHNMLFVLKAKELGLDTLITGIRDAEKVRAVLQIPENERIGAIIAVGYGTASAVKPKRKEPEEILKIF